MVNKVLQHNEEMHERVSAYIDNIFVNEYLISCREVRIHLRNLGLQAKEPEISGQSTVADSWHFVDFLISRRSYTLKEIIDIRGVGSLRMCN